MKAFRVVTVTRDRADLSVQAGENMEEIINSQSSRLEVLEVKNITQDLRIDLYEIQEALRYYKVDELVQMLVISILDLYDNAHW